jgi:hypothetical protein
MDANLKEDIREERGSKDLKWEHYWEKIGFMGLPICSIASRGCRRPKVF